MMPVRVLIAVLIVLFVCLLAAAVDRAIKTTKRNRRRLDATRRRCRVLGPVTTSEHC